MVSLFPLIQTFLIRTSLQPKLPLHLPPTLLPLQFLPLLLRLLCDTLFAFGSLSLLVCGSRLHDALDDLARIHVLKAVVRNLFVDAEGLRWGIWVVGEWHEGGDSVVNGGGRTVGHGSKEGFGEGEGSAEDDGVDVLVLLVGVTRGRAGMRQTLHCRTQSPRSKMFMMG